LGRRNTPGADSGPHTHPPSIRRHTSQPDKVWEVWEVGAVAPSPLLRPLPPPAGVNPGVNPGVNSGVKSGVNPGVNSASPTAGAVVEVTLAPLAACCSPSGVDADRLATTSSTCVRACV
jgi:hypothetical protein